MRAIRPALQAGSEAGMRLSWASGLKTLLARLKPPWRAPARAPLVFPAPPPPAARAFKALRLHHRAFEPPPAARAAAELE